MQLPKLYLSSSQETEVEKTSIVAEKTLFEDCLLFSHMLALSDVVICRL